MDLTQYVLNNSLLDLSRFTDIKDTEFRPGYDLTALKYLRDKAGRERDLRELYRGRAPYELLQNADDAKAKTVVFILSDEGLAFAHDGNWFTVANFRSLADGWSDKDPSQCIGHKGLGFRSVLDLTPSPHLVSLIGSEFFAVKFAWALNNGHFQDIFKRNPSLRSYYNDWTKTGQLVCPVMSIPGIAKKQGLGAGVAIYDRLIKGQYGKCTTLFWLPDADTEIPKRTLEELSPTPISEDVLRGFLTDEVSVLLPFLKSVEKVLLFRMQERIGSVELKGSRNNGVVSVTTTEDGNSFIESFFQMRFSLSIPPHISVDATTPKAVKAMSSAGITFSVRLADSQPVADDDSQFHVYFPTEEKTGLGFVVHGDFYVKPDRTRLMSAAYNTWLLTSAAQKAANEFLTDLLDQYESAAVFRALSGTEQRSDSAETFIDAFSQALAKRKTAYIPSPAGLLKSDEAVLAPHVDPNGFWHSHFSSKVGYVLKGKKDFVLPDVDDESTRKFFSLAQLQILSSDQLLDLIEAASQEARSMDWWYQCYEFLSQERNLALKEVDYFTSRKLIPISDGSVIAVAENRDLLVCLPPRGDTEHLQVPKCFSSSFVFINSYLAQLLHEGKGAVRSWILNRLQIARFEASDLLPRAIRNVAPKVFNGGMRLTDDELKELWTFVFRVIQLSRVHIDAAEFWTDIGRLPLPLETSGKAEEGSELVPASLLYWADRGGSLDGVSGLRRVDNGFIEGLVKTGTISKNEWFAFFTRAGVSNTPQWRMYSRVIASDGDTPFQEDLLSEEVAFSGEHQRDQNRAALICLRSDPFWNELVRNAPICTHESKQVLQSIGVIEGLRDATSVAQREYEAGDEHWQERLWSLLRTLPPRALDRSRKDTVFCFGGRGHSIDIGQYASRQIDNLRFLPSSQGPVARNACFVRQSSRRLISTGIGGDEIGDKLLPYVVVADFRDGERLRELGLETLDDVGSASTKALVRALTIIGERLSTDLGEREILSERGRWRLVRGAIQDIYRRLNQQFSTETASSSWFKNRRTKFARRVGNKVAFSDDPLFFAKPGSPIETAFQTRLALFDADRPLPSLFRQAGVTQLIPGETVVESFDAAKNFTPAKQLREELETRIAPLLLAYVISLSGSSASDPILRRLDGLEVRAVRNLNISFSLVSDPSVSATVDYKHFYLQSLLTARTGGGRERRFTLYVKGTDSTSVADIDADELGEILASVFDDGASAEMQGTFARILARYQAVNGSQSEMQDYLYSNLGISSEALDSARAVLSGEVASAPPPAPPPAQVHKSQSTTDNVQIHAAIAASLVNHQTQINSKTSSLVLSFAGTSSKPNAARSTSNVSGQPSGPTISAEQKKRGLEGEEEIKRRLQLPEGWEGLTLVKDRRDDGCGYDFLCELSGQEVMLEIKTFLPGGRVFVSTMELRMAFTGGNDYYLVGVVHENVPRNEWATHLLQNPAAKILIKGEFVIQADLKLQAADLFG